MSFPTSKLEADRSFDALAFKSLKAKFDNVVVANLVALALERFTGKVGEFTVNSFTSMPAGTTLTFSITHTGARTNQFIMTSLETAGEAAGTIVYLESALINANGIITFTIRNTDFVTPTGAFTVRIKYIIIDP